jgi:hypothetical protein
MFIKKKNKINLKNYKNNILIYFQIKKIITVKNSNTCQRLSVMEHCHHTISSKADMQTRKKKKKNQLVIDAK